MQPSMEVEENTEIDFTDCWKVDGELVVGLNLGATHITTACLRLTSDEPVPMPLMKLEGNEAYKDYIKSVLQYEPDPDTTTGLITVNGVNVQPLSHYDNDSIHTMFKQTFEHVLGDLRVKYGIESKLGLILCPRNLGATSKRLIYPDWESASHCSFPNANPTQFMNVASGVVMMDGISGTRRGYGIMSIEEEDKFAMWFIITVAVYSNMVQILVDEGPMMDHYTFAHKCISDISIDQNGDWTCLTDFQRTFATAMEEFIGKSCFDQIARVVITGDIKPSAAAQLSAAIENIAPELHGRIQGAENPAFITAMGAACISYEFHHAKPRGQELQYLTPASP